MSVMTWNAVVELYNERGDLHDRVVIQRLHGDLPDVIVDTKTWRAYIWAHQSFNPYKYYEGTVLSIADLEAAAAIVGEEETEAPPDPPTPPADDPPLPTSGGSPPPPGPDPGQGEDRPAHPPRLAPLPDPPLAPTD